MNNLVKITHAAVAERKKPYDLLLNFLREYRSMTRTATVKVPYELLMGCSLTEFEGNGTAILINNNRAPNPLDDLYCTLLRQKSGPRGSGSMSPKTLCQQLVPYNPPF